MAIQTSNGPDPTNCCCDVCGFSRISCNGSGEVPLFAICCKCVPKVLCGVFTPDDPEQCPPIGLFISHGGLGQYHGSLGDQFGYEDTLVDVTLQKDEYTGECYWKLSIPDLSIDERKTIDRVYQTCHNVSFQVRLANSYCAGEFVVSVYELAKVPFIREPLPPPCTNTVTWHGTAAGTIPGSWIFDSETYPGCCTPEKPTFMGGPGDVELTSCTDLTPLSADFQCGTCTEACRFLCVQYPLFDDELNMFVTIRKQFIWSETYQRYEYSINGDDDFIYLETGTDYETGYTACFLVLDIVDLADKDFEPYNLEPCTPSISAQITDLDNSITVTVECKICSCWKYICGSCRCACNMFCLLIYREGVLQLLQLPWFFDEETGDAGWSDGYETVTLTEDETTKQCKISINGFDPILMATCGTEIEVQLENTETNAQAFGGCRKCLCFASDAKCCTRFVSELPLKLVATIAEFDHCGCAGGSFDLIWNPFMFWWRGSGTLGSCYNYSKVTVTVGCPDIVGLQAPVNVVTVCGDDGDGPISHQADPTNIIISCDPILIVTDEITVDMSCCDDGPVDEPYDEIGPIPHPGMFTVTISE